MFQTKPRNPDMAKLLGEALAHKIIGIDQKSLKLERRLQRYREHPISFVIEVLGVDPNAYQRQILNLLRDNYRVAVHGPRNMGKSAVAAWCALWVYATAPSDVKVITTAGSWGQLIHYLWPEIRKWALSPRAHWERAGIEVRDGKEMLALKMINGNTRLMTSASSANNSLIEGGHADTVMALIDEAKSVPTATYDSLEGTLSGAGKGTELKAYFMIISIPGGTSGRFYEICSKRPGYEHWAVKHVTIDEVIAAGRVAQEWVDQQKKAWGESSALFQNHVLGNFADEAADVVIPLAWIEAAIARGAEHNWKGEKGSHLAIGCDPAYEGDDHTSVAILRGMVCESITSFSRIDPMQTAGRCIMALQKNGGDNQTAIGVDTIGLGAGVYARLKELKYNAKSIKASSSTKGKDRSKQLSFMNVRSELWWLMREALDPQFNPTLCLPDDPGLIGDLCAPKWWPNSKGAIVIEPKSDIRTRLGRSPDKADALALALYVAKKSIGISWTN